MLPGAALPAAAAADGRDFAQRGFHFPSRIRNAK
jgi:hypothetical protein